MLHIFKVQKLDIQCLNCFQTERIILFEDKEIQTGKFGVKLPDNAAKIAIQFLLSKEIE